MQIFSSEEHIIPLSNAPKWKIFQFGAPQSIVEVIGLMPLAPHELQEREFCRNNDIIFQMDVLKDGKSWAFVSNWSLSNNTSGSIETVNFVSSQHDLEENSRSDQSEVAN